MRVVLLLLALGNAHAATVACTNDGECSGIPGTVCGTTGGATGFCVCDAADDPTSQNMCDDFSTDTCTAGVCLCGTVAACSGPDGECTSADTCGCTDGFLNGACAGAAAPNCLENSAGTGVCAACEGDIDCTTAPTLTCSADWVCVQCESDDDCSIEAPTCSGSGLCVCESNTDDGTDACAATMYCDESAASATLACVECLASDTCGANEFCNSNGVCSLCAGDDDCTAPGLDYCFTPLPGAAVPASSCVECLTDGECALDAAPKCHNQDTATSSCGCADGVTCSGGTSYCDISDDTCYECTANSHCDGVTPDCIVSNVCGCTNASVCPTNNPVCESDACACHGETCTADQVCKDVTDKCVECVADLDCSVGVCDAATNMCVACMDNDDCSDPDATECITAGAATSADHACGCETADACADGYCNAGTCVECTENSQCSGTTDTCNAFACECAVGSEVCTSPMFCDAILGCIECDSLGIPCSSLDAPNCVAGFCMCGTDDECNTTVATADTVCLDNTGCVECTSNDHCDGDYSCDIDTNTCLECLEDNECDLLGLGTYCVSDECVDCKTDGDCSGTTPICGDDGACAACAETAECAAIDAEAAPTCLADGSCGCETESACEGMTPYCVASVGCSECSSSAHCHPSKSDTCTAGTCMCGTEELCDFMCESSACVECTENAECGFDNAGPAAPAGGDTCDAGVCYCGAGSTICDSGSYCKAEDSSCVDCLDDMHCSGRGDSCTEANNCTCGATGDLCTEDEVCSGGACFECIADTDCADDDVCSDLSTCVECNSVTDCPLDNSTCTANECACASYFSLFEGLCEADPSVNGDLNLTGNVSASDIIPDRKSDKYDADLVADIQTALATAAGVNETHVTITGATDTDDGVTIQFMVSFPLADQDAANIINADDIEDIIEASKDEIEASVNVLLMDNGYNATASVEVEVYLPTGIEASPIPTPTPEPSDPDTDDDDHSDHDHNDTDDNDTSNDTGASPSPSPAVSGAGVAVLNMVAALLALAVMF